MSATDGAVAPIGRAIAELVDRWPAVEDAVRADDDDAVHQMRVAIRRIRSLLPAAPKPGTDAAALDTELRWLAGVLGTARDAEVLAQRYRQALDRLTPELVRGRVVERLVDTAMADYRSGWAASLAALDSPRYRRLLARLSTPADRPVTQPADKGSPDTVQAAYRRVRKATVAARVGGAGRDEALHRIRKTTKRLRYTAEALDTPSIAGRAKTIQGLLGEHQDSVVSRRHLLAEAGAAAAAGEDTFTYGLLYQQEADTARDCRTRLDEVLDELATSMAAWQGGRAGL